MKLSIQSPNQPSQEGCFFGNESANRQDIKEEGVLALFSDSVHSGYVPFNGDFLLKLHAVQK